MEVDRCSAESTQGYCRTATTWSHSQEEHAAGSHNGLLPQLQTQFGKVRDTHSILVCWQYGKRESKTCVEVSSKQTAHAVTDHTASKLTTPPLNWSQQQAAKTCSQWPHHLWTDHTTSKQTTPPLNWSQQRVLHLFSPKLSILHSSRHVPTGMLWWCADWRPLTQESCGGLSFGCEHSFCPATQFTNTTGMLWWCADWRPLTQESCGGLSFGCEHSFCPATQFTNTILSDMHEDGGWGHATKEQTCHCTQLLFNQGTLRYTRLHFRDMSVKAKWKYK